VESDPRSYQRTTPTADLLSVLQKEEGEINPIHLPYCCSAFGVTRGRHDKPYIAAMFGAYGRCAMFGL
jgi:hypothetical protein